ncbi:hypothetical protein [Streptomyces sp. NRRL S-15]|uniref:hypothetical protein n=1 Tax=Streptomyces sp. NRRL S-15 TaxID=1463886 RepID=UPI0004CBBD02|nr:hypothetical protein [Streptomyces sp. NRRL S-15]
MSDAAPADRQIFTGVEASGKFPIEYRFTHARNGNRRLMVVFANLNAPDEYGWSNGVLDKTRSNILWIRDKFDGVNSYYLCKEMDFSLEESVIGLISRVMHALELTPDDCIMFGSSKGGTAALYYGLKYGFRDIVASVPQFAIGSFVRDHMKPTARFMMGEGVPESNVQIIDSLLPDTVWRSGNRGANIYLISSPQDEQYKQHVEPYIGHFREYSNFNFIYNDSPLIAGHGKVTLRNLPVMLGLANLLVDGVRPRIGSIRNGYEQPDRSTAGIDDYLRSTSRLKDTFAAPAVHAPVTGGTTSGRTVLFTGSAPGAVRVSLWENGKFLSSPQVGPDGNWSWDPGRDWSVGKHVVRLFAVDPAGFHSPRTEIVFSVPRTSAAPDSAAPAPAGAGDLTTAGLSFQDQGPLTPPLAPVVSVPVPGQHMPGNGVALSGYAPGAVRVEFGEGGAALGAGLVTPEGTWVWESGWSWAEGPHTVECFAVDAAGNKSRRVPVTFTVVNAFAAQSYGAYPGGRY